MKQSGIDCNWTGAEGWQNLSNGALVKAASAAGYVCLLTNDKKFADSAGNALSKNPSFSVIEITLPQSPKAEFSKSFSQAWSSAPIVPVPAKVIKWPH